MPYLKDRQDELGNVIAGLCIDSIGNDFARCGGRMMVAGTPDENASFVDALLDYLFRQVAALPASRFSADTYATFYWAREPFCGNDGFISDSFFDIPTPQMSTWPERFYHSAQDTPDKMSPNTLGRNGLIAALYLYLLASAERDDALWMARLSAQDWKKCIVEAVSEMTDSDVQLPSMVGKIHYLGLIAQDAVANACKLASQDSVFTGQIAQMQDELAEFAHREARILPAEQDGGMLEENGAAACQVFTRVRWQRPADEALSEPRRAQLAALRAQAPGIDRVWLWINGRRSVADIWARAQAEQSVSLKVVNTYLALLKSEGVICT